MKRTVFFLSDHTGLTAEAMGRSLLTQFGQLEYDVIQWPFLDSMDKIRNVVRQINHVANESQVGRPLIFSTLVDPKMRTCLKESSGLVMDYFEAFTGILEQELHSTSAHIHGQVHSMANANAYQNRITAVNFALANDDGAVTRNYDRAEVILIGVSRSGKTPTCLYMGLQHGVLAANYPLTEDDLHQSSLPNSLKPHKHKLYGLTIAPPHLQKIRQERRAHGRYATLEQCTWEVERAETLYRMNQVRSIDTTSMSIEEIAARILADMRKGAEQD